MPNKGKQQSKKVLLVYGISVLLFFIAVNTPISVHCLFKTITGIPCPGCGLSRAFILASQFKFAEAIKMNLSFLFLAIGLIVYFLCALIDLFSKKHTINKFNSVMANKFVITFAVTITALSWWYNIVRDI